MTKMILVVEDDDTINEVVSEYLREAGYFVTSADNGKQAAEIIAQRSDIDLCVLDIMLPGISGLMLLKAIRANENHKQTPVIMLTALTDENTQLESFNDMADDYVTKPFSAKILVKRVEALLRRSSFGVDAGVPSDLQAGNIIRMGELYIDMDRYEAFEDNEKIRLTLKEFELLKILMGNPQMVLSRQQLLDAVWGYDYFGDERIVDVHIKNLRKKLKTDLITTVKGVGYSISRG